MTTNDPAAIAASTAQGWAYALNTVARPAPEHLEAAQDALTALESADRGDVWRSCRASLSEALTAARIRVDGKAAITVDQLLDALAALQGAGLAVGFAPPGPEFREALADSSVGPRGMSARIEELERELAEMTAERDQLEADAEDTAELEASRAELKAELEKTRTQEREAAADALTVDRALTEARRGQTEAVRQRDLARREAQEARDKLRMHVQTAELTAVRGHRLEVLKALGYNPPGFAHMDATELADTEHRALRTAAESGNGTMNAERDLRRAWQMLRGMQGPNFTAVRPDKLADLARTVMGMAETALHRFADLEREAAQKADFTLASWNAQAETIREQRERIAELERELTPGALQMEED